MGICKDKATVYLNRLGYSALRVPQAGIFPLLLLGKQGKSVSVLGTLNRLITTAPVALPEVTRDQRATDLEGQESSKLDLAIGVGILGTFIGALGGNAGVKAKYATAQAIQFRFSDVLVDRVMALDVGNYLREGEVDARNVVLEQYVLGEGELYLITETVKTRSLTVVTSRKDGTQVDLDVPAIQSMMSGSLKVEASGERSASIKYTGDEYLTFGFKSYRVGVEGGTLAMLAADESAIALSSHAAASSAVPTVLESNGLLSLTVPAHP